MAALSEVPLAVSIAKRKSLLRRVRAALTTLPHSSSRRVARTSGCSWISSYMWFFKASSPCLDQKIVAAGWNDLVSRASALFPLVDHLTGHDGLEHSAILIQDHEVGIATDGDLPFPIQDQSRRGSLGSHAYSLGQRDSQEPDGVSYGLVHGECATSERPVGKPNRTIFQANLASP